jgi:hypothetical protein
MKKSELQQIIREEISKVLSEAPNTITISYDGKKLTIDSESFKRLKAGKDVVGNNLEKGGQEEWIRAKGNWREASIKENTEKYMFFQNLETIKKEVDEMLSLDPQQVDAILANGHDWAADHIATSKDDIEEVHNFLMSNKAPMDELSKKQQKIAKAAPPEDKITGADFAALRKGK